MLSVFFVSHLPESFTPKFEELFQLAEVIAMEFAYSDGEEQEEKYWNAVSRGEKLPPASVLSGFGEFTKGLLDRLFFAHKSKSVEFERSPVKKTEDEQMNALYQEARRLWRQKQVPKALEELGKWEQVFAMQIQKRDISYSRQLQSLMSRNAPRRILCVRGLLHKETLSKELRQKGVVFDSYLFKEPYVHSIADSVTIASLHEEVLSDDTLVRLLIEQDYADKEIIADNYKYETRLGIREKVLSMTQAEIDEYVASMKVK